jgi:hypothetical protein
MVPAQADSNSPRPGEVQRLTVITLSLQVGSTEKETKQVTYSPPPGWYVRSHTVECSRKVGNSSFTVNTVPKDWAWASEEKVGESYKNLIEAAARAHNSGLQAELLLEREAWLRQLRQVRSSHHALVVEATARGEGLLRGGGGLELTVTAELVFVGTEEALTRRVAQHRARLP